jgi:hypothetical protein
MKTVFRTVLLLSLALFLFVAVPSRAEARMFSFWAEGRGDVFSGSSDLFSELESPFGGGLEVGFEIIEISLIGELLAMSEDWWLYTVHLGVDFDFGEEDSTRFTLGVYTGLMYFDFPELPPKVDFSVMTPDEQDRLVAATGVCADWTDPTQECPGIQLIEADLSRFSEQEEMFSGAALGWNIIRLRLAVDYPVASFFYLGIATQLGYHFIVTGEDVTAEAKNQAVDAYIAKANAKASASGQNGVDPVLAARLKDAVGARPLDEGELDGLNYGIHIYARFEFGI